MIEEVEEAYHNNLFNIARQVVRRGKCPDSHAFGPSSSGKTTTAHMLQRELAELGEDSVIVSMDDFYLGANQAPILPDGTYDYEAVEALNVPLAKKCLSDLLLTGRCDMPVFDFHNRKPADYTRPLELKDNAVAIIEGIHALNPVFTQHLPRERVMKLYTSVKQGIKDANGMVISPMGSPSGAPSGSGLLFPQHQSGTNLFHVAQCGGRGKQVYPPPIATPAT